MDLQRQRRAGIDDDALHLEAVAGVHALVASPRPIHLAMDAPFGPRLAFQARHDLAHVLGAVAARHHHGVRRLDHHHVVESDAGEQPVLRDQQRLARVHGADVALHHVAVAVLRADLPQGVPCPDVRPAGVEPDDGGKRLPVTRAPRPDALHDRVVDRILRARLERARVDVVEIPVALPLPVCPLAGAQHVRPQAPERLEPDRAADRENPAVPQVGPGSGVALRRFGIRFLDERIDPVGGRSKPGGKLGPGPHIAVAGLRRRGWNPEGDHPAPRRERRAAAHRLVKGGPVGDDMIGGHHQQHRVALRGGMQRGEGQRRGRAAARRLEDDCPRLRPDPAQLIGHQKAILLVAQQQRCGIERQALEPPRRFLEQAQLPVQRQQLLGVLLARQRPQARAGAAAEYDGLDLHVSSFIVRDSPVPAGARRAIRRQGRR